MITVTFWICLLATGACKEHSAWSTDGGPMGCAGAGAFVVAWDWAKEHPKYRIDITRAHPIRCTSGEEKSL